MTDDTQEIDLVADEVALARAQIDAGLFGLAEGTVQRRLALREAEDAGGDAESEALRVLLAEALWRQGRPAAARASLEGVRPGSPQRRLPIAMLIEAETLAAAGELDRAAGAQERLLTAVGVEAAFDLLGGVPGRLTWPLPARLQPLPARDARAPWSADEIEPADRPVPAADDERVAAARGRMEEARVAYVAGELERGDAELAIAMRLDPVLAGDGVAILEPTLGGQPRPERLLLYGDLLRAAGRQADAKRAYDRAASRRG